MHRKWRTRIKSMIELHMKSWGIGRAKQAVCTVFRQRGRWCSIIGSSWPLAKKWRDRLITPSGQRLTNALFLVRETAFRMVKANLLLHCLCLQVWRRWSLCWLLPERRTSRGSACFCAKLSWLFISHCSFMVWALIVAMNSSAWQHILSTTACGLLFLGEGPKSLLSQRGPSFHQVN